MALGTRADVVVPERGPAARAVPRDRLRLFHVDPDLLSRTPAERIDALERQITVPVERLPRGKRWEPRVPEDEIVVGFYVVSGALSRETRLFDRRAVELLGPGDVIRPTEGTSGATLPYEPSWHVVAESQVARLDAEFDAALRLMPGVAGQLVGRAVQRSRTLALQLAIYGIRDLRQRLLLMFWHLADRWGTREGEAVVLAVPLTHRLIADLVRASRPAVSSQLKELRERGLVTRGEDGRWRAHGVPPVTVEHLRSLFADH